MKEKTDKILTLGALGLAIVMAIIAIIFAINAGNGVIKDGFFDTTFWLLVCIMIFSIGAILYFFVKKLINRFKTEKGYLKKFLMIVGIVIVLAVISFLIAPSNDVDLIKYDITAGTSKLIGTVCIFCYILGVGAVLAIAVAECLPKTNKKK